MVSEIWPSVTSTFSTGLNKSVKYQKFLRNKTITIITIIQLCKKTD